MSACVSPRGQREFQCLRGIYGVRLIIKTDGRRGVYKLGTRKLNDFSGGVKKRAITDQIWVIYLFGLSRPFSTGQTKHICKNAASDQFLDKKTHSGWVELQVEGGCR